MKARCKCKVQSFHRFLTFAFHPLSKYSLLLCPPPPPPLPSTTTLKGEGQQRWAAN